MTLTADVTSATRTDDVPDHCFRCDYDLRGLSDEQPCPECGLLAVRSRRPSEELHDTRPAWLRRLSLGVVLILLALPANFLGEPLTEWALSSGPGLTQRYWLLRHLGPLFGGYAAWVMLMTGVFLVTTREGYEAADRRDARRRLLLRLAPLVPLAGLITLHVSVHLYVSSRFVRFTGYRNTDAYDIAAMLLLTVGSVPLLLLLMFQLRSLAKRARHPQLAEDCAIVAYGNAATLLLVPIVAALMEVGNRLGGAYWTSRSTLALVLALVVVTAAVVFALWNVYLLVRFAIAFAVAARARRRLWRRDDRSVVATE